MNEEEEEAARLATIREDQARREKLWAQWGKPESVDATHAAELLGLPYQIDMLAFRYASLEAARAYAASNLEHHGHLSLGIAETPEGVIGIIYVPMPPPRHR